uniref:FTH domain-containing protein n=1 Tax=Steinernema glaseri TaxID=37863 RepID=A0A1I8AFL8_9BILA
MDDVPYAFCDAVFACLETPSSTYCTLYEIPPIKDSLWYAVALDHRKKRTSFDFFVYMTPEGLFYEFRLFFGSNTVYSFKELRQIDIKYLRMKFFTITQEPRADNGVKPFPVSGRSLEKIIKYIQPVACSANSLTVTVPNSLYSELLPRLLEPLQDSSFWNIDITEYNDAAINFLKKYIHNECLYRVDIGFRCSDELLAILEDFHCPETHKHITYPFYFPEPEEPEDP